MEIKNPLNFKLKGEAKYVLEFVTILTYTKKIEDVFWWQAQLEDRLTKGRN